MSMVAPVVFRERPKARNVTISATSSGGGPARRRDTFGSGHGLDIYDQALTAVEL
jgi:hypothetical protein